MRIFKCLYKAVLICWFYPVAAVPLIRSTIARNPAKPTFVCEAALVGLGSKRTSGSQRTNPMSSDVATGGSEPGVANAVSCTNGCFSAWIRTSHARSYMDIDIGQLLGDTMRRVGALIFPGFELLDLFGPLEMLGLLKDEFDLKLIAETLGPVESNQQVRANPDVSIEDADNFDVLLIPGGMGTRREVTNSTILNWIRKASDPAEYVLSICTGSLLLAGAGVLDGRRATTNKAAFPKIAAQGPSVEWVKQARWVEDGKFITSSGVSAGMDMTLRAIALMHDQKTAEKVAMWSEYDWHQDANWDPFAKFHGLV